MAGFLYFVEGHPTNKPVVDRDIQRWGLTHAFDSVPFNAHLYSSTPSDRPGVLMADQSRLGPYQPRYSPSEQTWQQILGGQWWLGFYNEARPTPVDLGRNPLVDGYLIELADGFRWQVPLVRKFIDVDTSGTCLPRYRTMAYCDRGEGRWIDGPIVDTYLPVCEITEEFWSKWRASLVSAVADKQDSFEVMLEKPERDAAMILGVNYAVSEFELSSLRVFANDNYRAASEILRLACDCDTAIDWLTYQKESADDA